jgi:hypothetical protein
MDDTTHSGGSVFCEAPEAGSERRELPPLSNDEREFWRRAVAIERARQGRARPPPFPFQAS